MANPPTKPATKPKAATKAATLQEIQRLATDTQTLGERAQEFANRQIEKLAGGPQEQKYPATDFSGSLRYPSDPGIDANTDYVMFNFYKYIAPFDGRDGGGSNAGLGLLGAITSAAGAGEAALGRYNSTAMQYVRSKKNTKQILLYMPEDISTGYKTNWMGRNFQSNTGDMMRTAGAANLFAAADEAFRGLAKVADRAPAIAKAQMISDKILAETGESISTNDFFGVTRGVVFNPNTELLFQGVDLRSFTLKFKLVPRTANEATIIEAIIYTFKKAMLPAMSDGQDVTSGLSMLATFGLSDALGIPGGMAFDPEALNQNYIQVPDLCQITYMTGSNKNTHVPQFKMCAISQVDVNYTPDGVYATTSDKRMVAYELSLSFQETKLIFSEEVQHY